MSLADVYAKQIITVKFIQFSYLVQISNFFARPAYVKTYPQRLAELA